MAETELMTTGQLARFAKTTERTVRYYRHEKLITAEVEGYRPLFGKKALQQIQRIQCLQESNLSIAEIRTLFSLVDTDPWTDSRLTIALRDSVEKVHRRLTEKLEDLVMFQKRCQNILAQTEGCTNCSGGRTVGTCSGCGTLKSLRTLGVTHSD